MAFAMFESRDGGWRSKLIRGSRQPQCPSRHCIKCAGGDDVVELGEDLRMLALDVGRNRIVRD